MRYANPSPLSPWAKKSLSFLIWMSPLFALGIFFPLGVLFAFPKGLSIRIKSMAVIAIYVMSWVVFYPIELLHRSSLDFEMKINAYLADGQVVDYGKGLIVILVGIFLFVNYVHSSWRDGKRREIRQAKLDIISPGSKIRTGRTIRDSKLDVFFLTFILALLLSYVFQILLEKLNPPNTLNPLASLSKIYQFGFNYLLSNAILVLSFNRGKIPSLLAYPILAYQKGIRLREAWREKSDRNERFPFLLGMKVKQKALFRETMLPGWGHVYLEDYWRGFPFLFVGLLLWLFLAIWTFSYLSPVFGIQFLGSMGLKPGIADKDFFVTSQNIAYSVITVIGLISVYIYSRSLLNKSFSLENLGYRKAGEEELDPIFESGLRRGFRNTLPVSLLLHLLILSIVFIIPISIQRSSSKKNNAVDKAKHHEPEKIEFYFIDPNIPDETLGLNGGVVTGTDTTNKEQGEKISNQKIADNGPKSGHIKKIRGKKIPPTYSNYISAKMRVPESYMDYWAKAPHPYSSVVAYTITSEGDVTNVEIVEGSNYPEHDRLTLELIENLGPLIPPPKTEGDIRVTELFWNGPIDPDFVPTPLQKEMVNMFDGRYMEEIPE